MIGYEVAQQIRKQSALKNSVLVAMTGYRQESDRKSSQDAGFDHHLVKPANFFNDAGNPGICFGIIADMNTPEEMETDICQGIGCLEQESRGRFPKETRARPIGDLHVVRLQSVLTAAEQQLAMSPPLHLGRIAAR